MSDTEPSKGHKPSEEIYAAYCRAMAAAQRMEQAVAARVMRGTSPREQERGLRLTLGQMIGRLMSFGDLAPETLDALAGALSARNRLAHDYFVDRTGTPESERHALIRLEEVFIDLETTLIPGFRFESSGGQTYVLHQRDVTLRGGRVQRIFFFALRPTQGVIPAVPPGYIIVENPRTGLPILKKP
jgi:hypothetical protein